MIKHNFQPTSHYHSSLHIDFPPSRTTPVHHDFIIEKEVMEVLPSVKELAKCYSGSQQDVSAVPKPLHRPKVRFDAFGEQFSYLCEVFGLNEYDKCVN